MKFAGILLSVLMLFGAVYVGITGSSMSLDLSDKVVSISGSLSDAELKATGLPSAERLRFGGILGILGSVCALALLVLTWVRKEKIPIAALATLSLFALAVIIYPTFESGPPADLTPRTHAMIAAVLALAGALGAMLVKVDADRRGRVAALSLTSDCAAEHREHANHSVTLSLTSDNFSALGVSGTLAALISNDDLSAKFGPTNDQCASLSQARNHCSPRSG